MSIAVTIRFAIDDDFDANAGIERIKNDGAPSDVEFEIENEDFRGELADVTIRANSSRSLYEALIAFTGDESSAREYLREAKGE